MYWLARSNRRYYQRMGERPTKANLTAVISDLPAGAGASGKYFVGFYDGEDLVAVLDLICDYPSEHQAFVGWFMVAADRQNQGVGSSIFADVRAALFAQGYTHLELQLPEPATEAIAFWEAQGFAIVGREEVASKRQPDRKRVLLTLARDI